jgi:putative endopeptidase
MPNLVRDFYNYINKKELAKNKIPNNNVSVSVFDKIEESIRVDIQDLLKNKSSGPLKAFVKSIYDGRKNDISTVEEFCKTMTGFTSYEELFLTFGKLNLYGISCPLEFDISNDSRDTSTYIVYITEPGFGIIKEEIQQKGTTYKQFEKFIIDTSAAISDEGIAKEYMNFVCEMSKIYYDYEDNYKVEVIYNPMTYKQICSNYPLMQNFFSVFGKVKLEKLVCLNPGYLLKFYDSYKNYDLELWKRFIRLNIYLSFLEDLPEPFSTIFFDFSHKFLLGQKKQHDKDYKMFKISSEMCENAVGKLYVSSNLKRFQEIKVESTKLFNIVMAQAKKRVLKLNWLSQTSRKIAYHKLEKMGLKMAFPQVWEDDFKDIKISEDQFIKNILVLTLDGSMRDIKKLTYGQDKSIWNNDCFVVNAYYYPEFNELCLPLGFLNAPFFSLDQSFIENLAGLGNIIGHEISHGFDEEGRKFDEHGNYKPWWTSIDVEIYNEQTKILVEEFSKQKYHGLRISGELTLGENLADFGAMRICLDVIKNQGGDTKKNFQNFFIAYAKTWIYKERAEKREQAVKKDRHAPPQLRVNVIVRHFDEFYEAFDIKEDDEGFIPEEERIRIWG